MKITIEVDNVEEAEHLMEWLRKENFIRPDSGGVSIHLADKKPMIQKGDKTVDPTGLFGIWKDNPRTLEEIRREAWGDRL
jgi:hypothetical protein